MTSDPPPPMKTLSVGRLGRECNLIWVCVHLNITKVASGPLLIRSYYSKIALVKCTYCCGVNTIPVLGSAKFWEGSYCPGGIACMFGTNSPVGVFVGGAMA